MKYDFCKSEDRDDLLCKEVYLSEIEELTKKLKNEKNFLNSILNNAGMLILILKKDTTIITFNRYAEESTGFTKNEVIGKKYLDILIPEKLKGEVTGIMNNMGKGILPRNSEGKMLCKDGREIDILWNNSITQDGQGNEYIICMGIDITMYNESKEELKKSEDKVLRTAYYDCVTNLPNRRYFINTLNNELKKVREDNQKGAIFFIDVDNFKKINDTLGHAVGDELLKKITRKLKSVLDENITLARLGGDEFILLHPNIKEIKEVKNTAKKVLELFQNIWNLNRHEVVTTASIGISVYPNDGCDVDSLMKNADMAMYAAKETGKNSYEFFKKSMKDAMIGRLKLEEKMRRAINNDEFEVYYQPQVDIKTKKITSVEALIRWNDPETGVVSPVEFIPLAEETRLIIPIGEFVLRKACNHIKRFQQISGLPLSVAVNISSIQLQQRNFIKTIENILAETKLKPEFLELEITESVLMQSFDKSITTLNRLKEMGVKIALDDFGTGYSSLNYLKSLPIDTLKIDKSFVDDIKEKCNEKEIVGITIMLAHKLNLEVVAEGVEFKEQLEFLEAEKCNKVQGYLFSKPLPVKELEEKLKV